MGKSTIKITEIHHLKFKTILVSTLEEKINYKITVSTLSLCHDSIILTYLFLQTPSGTSFSFTTVSFPIIQFMNSPIIPHLGLPTLLHQHLIFHKHYIYHLQQSSLGSSCSQTHTPTHSFPALMLPAAYKGCYQQ